MYIGIDLGGTNIAVGLVDDTGKIVKKSSTPTMKERDYKLIIDDMANLAIKVTKDAGYSTQDIKAVGIGCPGTVDNKSGKVVYCNNIKMDNVPLADLFKKYIDVPVYLANDAGAAAYGEYSVIDKEIDSFLFVTLGTGVGGGIIIDGKIYNGFNGSGAEVGHTTIIVDGKDCPCGKTGCLEQYASVTALIEQTKEKMSKNPDSMMHEWVNKNGNVNGRTAFECAKAGDTAAKEVKDQYIKYVSIGLSNLVNIFQPDMLVIGGGISREKEELIKPIRNYVYEKDYNKYLTKTEIVAAKLLNDAGIIGAAMLARNNCK